MVEVLDEIKVALKNGKITYGTEKVIKLLKTKSLTKVILSKNVPEDVIEDIKTYTSLSEIPVEKVGFTNEELGTFCKRTHLVSVLGILS